MTIDSVTQKLDQKISSLENELGVSSVCINPDDPWASYRMATFSVSPQLSVRSCNKCSYTLTLPFEKRCPQCEFKGEQKEMFPLLSIEQMLASLPKKGAPPVKSKKKVAPAVAAPVTLSEAWGNCNIQVSKIVSVDKHPKGDQLFVIQLDAGLSEPRQVCAGLVQFYKAEDLVGKLVCTVMNLKASKLMGVKSAAMILAGSAGDQVRVVEPPKGSEIGDRLFTEGGEAGTTPKTLNSKFWKAVVPEFKVQENKATFNGKAVVTSKGPCSVPDLPNGSEIH